MHSKNKKNATITTNTFEGAFPAAIYPYGEWKNKIKIANIQSDTVLSSFPTLLNSSSSELVVAVWRQSFMTNLVYRIRDNKRQMRVYTKWDMFSSLCAWVKNRSFIVIHLDEGSPADVTSWQRNNSLNLSLARCFARRLKMKAEFVYLHVARIFSGTYAQVGPSLDDTRTMWEDFFFFLLCKRPKKVSVSNVKTALLVVKNTKSWNFFYNRRQHWIIGF